MCLINIKVTHWFLYISYSEVHISKPGIVIVVLIVSMKDTQ